MELIEFIEAGLYIFANLFKLVLEAIALLCILWGLIKTLQLSLNYKSHHRQNRFTKVRLEFGMWLVLALEFQLGADIVATTLSSDFTSLGKLVIIAIVRTVLNYFLTKELEGKLHE
ncbi:Sll0939 family stress-responsive protein [Cyanobacterium sp. HL-69]|uniref:DUF1622 domain-containing protein n=1 Tax=unclassified Cyanobacterium TaxID=2629879 RepID=UPI0008527C3D|nr:DUF1622 domain-containing protein [Cyanobacterium sp. IPPAS B-1200]AUC61855.1 Sll0939 family stress-responsive protein [Cyanobacterium sp. HL-69]OEJ79039.1 hypothetical protein A5482_11320 [Cyanobacterium sp. IPPAS B-1200]